MKTSSLLVLLCFSFSTYAEDWPCWRGPTRDGVAQSAPLPPVDFSKPKWETPVPGRAHGSPIIANGKVFILAADEQKQTQSVICYDRKNGKEIWTTLVHQGGFTQRLNKKASWASGTPATDRENIYVSFLNGDTLHATALDFETGKPAWQYPVTKYKVHQGLGSSPLIWKDLVIIAADNKREGKVVGIEKATGKLKWEIKRSTENYPSPVVLNAAGKDQLFMTGTGKVSSFDPLTGKTHWEIDGSTTECVTTTVTDGERIFSSGGYPKNHVSAIEADGSGKIAWTVPNRVYVPSMVVRDGFLYAVMDAGVAVCWDSRTGREQWKGRLGGTYSSSLVLAGDHLYAASESGTLSIFRANPETFEVISKTEIAGEIYSTPALSDGELFIRVADYKGNERSERLVCY